MRFRYLLDPAEERAREIITDDEKATRAALGQAQKILAARIEAAGGVDSFAAEIPSMMPGEVASLCRASAHGSLGATNQLLRAYRKQRLTVRAAGGHDGMMPEAWAALWDAQEGRCYLCHDPLPGSPATDHDHRCCPAGASCQICRRGLACNACNRLIGMARDDPGRLHRIAGNLETAREIVTERMAREHVLNRRVGHQSNDETPDAASMYLEPRVS